MENHPMHQSCTPSSPEFTWANYDASVRCTSGVRFLSEDPIGFAGGINHYAYCNNNPVICNDPEGKSGIVGAGIGIVSGGVGGFIAGYSQNGNLLDGLIGLGAGAVVGGAAGFVNPFLSNAVGATAATSILGLAANGAGQVVGELATDAFNGQNLSIDNFNIPVFLSSGLLNPGAFSTSLFTNVATRTGSQTAGILTAGATEGLLGSAFEFGVDQTAGLFNFALDNGIPIGTPSIAAGATFADQFLSPNIGSGSANGGFVLYPNKINNNIQTGVYSK